MSKDFLTFWRQNTLDDNLSKGKMLNYAASNQYSRVSIGDTVWVVSVRAGRLRLVGRVVIGQIVDRDMAARAVGAEGLWVADHYILPAEGTMLPVADIDIHNLVPDLRFLGGTDRLTPKKDGLVSGQQIQAMRRLADNSPKLLAQALERGCESIPGVADGSEA